MIVRVICGPTAGGKSATAMKLAARYGAAIISADSRQVYRGFDIGTAKPSRADRDRAAHYGIDVADPAERYSAARWAESAAGWIDDSARRGLTPVIVGGTGLYIRALFEPLSPLPEFDPDRRRDLEGFLQEQTSGDLRRWCEMLDPPRAHLGKTQLVRAIETVLLSGSRISGIHERHRNASSAKFAGAPSFTPSYLLVDPGQSLQRRIETRVDEMLESGWLDEVRRLAGTVPADAPAWKASGYGAVRGVASGESDLATARARVIIETRQYAKRQRTWFRNQLPSELVTRYDPESPGGDLLAQRWWEEGSASR